MEHLIKDLIEENERILNTYPNIENHLHTSAGHRYMFNKEMIAKIKRNQAKLL